MASHSKPNPETYKSLKDPTLEAPDSAPEQRIRQARNETSTKAENAPRAGGDGIGAMAREDEPTPRAVFRAISESELDAEVYRFLESLR